MDMCCPFTALHSEPYTPSPPVLLCLAGGTQKQSIPLARLVLVLTLGSRSLLFLEPELLLCPQTSVCCKPRAALSLTHEGHVPGQAPVAKAHTALPLSTCSFTERRVAISRGARRGSMVTSKLENWCCHQGDVNCLL